MFRDKSSRDASPPALPAKHTCMITLCKVLDRIPEQIVYDQRLTWGEPDSDSLRTAGRWPVGYSCAEEGPSPASTGCRTEAMGVAALSGECLLLLGLQHKIKFDLELQIQGVFALRRLLSVRNYTLSFDCTVLQSVVQPSNRT